MTCVALLLSLCESAGRSAMVYLDSWDEFIRAAESLYQEDPDEVWEGRGRER